MPTRSERRAELERIKEAMSARQEAETLVARESRAAAGAARRCRHAIAISDCDRCVKDAAHGKRLMLIGFYLCCGGAGLAVLLGLIRFLVE